MEETPHYVTTDPATSIVFQNAKTYGAGMMDSHRSRNRVQKFRIQNSHRYRVFLNTIKWCRSNEVFWLDRLSLSPAESFLMLGNGQLYKTNGSEYLVMRSASNLNLLPITVDVGKYDVCEVEIYLQTDVFSMNKARLLYDGQPLVLPWYRIEENSIKKNCPIS